MAVPRAPQPPLLHDRPAAVRLLTAPAPPIPSHDAQERPPIRERIQEDPAPTQSLCRNPSSKGALCQQSPPTIVILVTGMCVMTFLVAIVILLLFLSRFRRRSELVTEEQHPEAHHEVTSTGLGSLTPSRPGSLVLVIFPGEGEPYSFARPCPFPTENEEAAADQLSGSSCVGGKPNLTETRDGIRPPAASDQMEASSPHHATLRVEESLRS